MQHKITFLHRLLPVCAACALLTTGALTISHSAPRPHQEDGLTVPMAAVVLVGADNYKASLIGTLRWARFPVRVAFVSSLNSGNQNLDALVKNGFDKWVRATQGDVKYEVVSNAARADITVTYDEVSGRPANGGRLGATAFSFGRESRLLKHADMHLNIWENMTRGDLSRFQNTAAHEFGHALGINGHSPDPHDLMYFSSGESNGITARDLNTLRQVYGGFTHPTVNNAKPNSTKRS